MSPKAIKVYQETLLELPRGYVAHKMILGKERFFETIRAIPYKRDKYKQLRVFKLVFDVGEYDMVIFDPEKLNCRLFEVKHTAERDDGQIRHLTDPEKLDWCTRNYGPILTRTVLYRGESFDHPTGVAYRNVGEYLKGLE